MTRTYCISRLLEHGPLTFHELMEITGWSYPVCESALKRLVKQGIVCSYLDVGCRRNRYRLA